MQSPSKLSPKNANVASIEGYPANDRQLTGLRTPPPAHAPDPIASKLNSEQYSLLFQNMPLGIMEESYAEVKKEVDKLVSRGVDNLLEYFLDNPETLFDLANKVEFISANKALLEIRGAETVEILEADETDVDSWWNDEWVEFYANEITCLAKSNACFGVELLDTRVDGTPYVSRTSTFVVAGCEHSWARVVSIHEDITDRKRMEDQIREAHNDLERQVRERTRELQEGEALLTLGARMAGLGYAVRDYRKEKYLTVSEEFARLYGYTREEFLARFDHLDKEFELIYPADRDAYRAACQKDIPAESSQGVTLRVVRRDGEVRYLMHSCKHVLGASGERSQSLVTVQDITDRKRVEEALENSHALYRQAEYMGNMGHWSWDHATDRMDSCSEQFARIFDMSVSGAIAYFRSFGAKMKLVHPEDRERFFQAFVECDRTRKGLEIEYRIITQSGNLRHVCLRSERVYDAQGTLLRSFGTVQDISERIHTEQELMTQSQITSNMAEGAMLVRASDSTIVYVNPAFESMFGYETGELIGEHVSRLDAAADMSLQEASGELIDERNSLATWRGEICNLRKDGTDFWCSVNLSVFDHPEFGKVWISVHSDTTERRQAEMNLSYQASHDLLTGLINRREFELRAERLITTTRKSKGEHALCFMDLDQFKIVNDTCGHTAGDELLQQLSQVLRDTVRKRDTLARLGGDEFGVLMEHCTLQQAQRAADALLERVADFQFSWEGQSFRLGASIGLVSISDTTTHLTELMRQADAACYMAKDLGRNRIHVYLPEDSDLARRHGEMQWVARIDQALEEERFTLYAQEIVPLEASAERQFELLLRLVGLDGKIIPPKAFLPAAERYDLVDKLDTWVVRHAFALMNAHPGFIEQAHRVSINLSGHSLSNSKFLTSLIEQIDEFDIDASRVCFEITETAAISNLNMATSFIARLKQLGCQFALDDFGSGLSSFAYLKYLPVDYLKIDGMFVKDMVVDPIDYAMVKSINEIGHVMGMKTIAEFVESDAIREKLLEIGIDCVQGYGIEKPRPFVDIIESFGASRD
jgi:diguanylate cyclase (GGDEF)-like protein/PAS domain S-box-containing protein